MITSTECLQRPNDNDGKKQNTGMCARRILATTLVMRPTRLDKPGESCHDQQWWCSTKTIKRSSCWSSSRQEIVVSGKPLPPVFLSGEPGDKTEYTLRSAWTSSFTPLSSSTSSVDLSDTKNKHIYVTFNNSPWVGLVPVHNIHLLDEITIIIVFYHHLHNNPREIASW